MGIIKQAGNILGLLLLGIAAVAVTYGLVMLVSIFIWGLTNVRLGGLFLAIPVAILAGFFGTFIRKIVAGTILPVHWDKAEAYRSFIGGGG